MADSNVTVSEGKKSRINKKSTRIVTLLLILVLVFTIGVLTGRWMKTNEFNNRFTDTVGSGPVEVEPYELTIFGETIQYTDDLDTNTSLDRDLLFGLTEKKLQKADIQDLIVVRNKAADLGATDAQKLIDKVLKQRVSELSAEQKQQLEAGGLEF